MVGPTFAPEEFAGRKLVALLDRVTLLARAAEVGQGFDHQIFASMLGGLNRFPDSMIPFAAEEYRG
ncbi:hypothetical protein CH299_21550 [Rhodococcus sp. 14-2686-1-2]|nr:hypothetical protein CH301_21030 [Rhodococcus sp. 15-1189-1-1a]OZF10839.1 hypothetical protein CH299_21550 [Rhodococcus sp. 14-2686-1-2]